jgi:hypothetical protein
MLSNIFISMTNPTMHANVAAHYMNSLSFFCFNKSTICMIKNMKLVSLVNVSFSAFVKLSANIIIP